MLIRVFVRNYIFTILLLVPVAIHAEKSNHVIMGINNLAIIKIDDFFLTQPTKKNAIWIPTIQGKSKYVFSIPKDAYLISKNHVDASDLFYLSEQIDSGLKFQSNNTKNIDITIAKNISKLIFRKSILSNINVGLLIENKEKSSFGLNLNKDIILSKNALGNISVLQAEGEHIVFDAKFVKLSNNENSEFYGNINHELRSNNLNFGIGNTWFDMTNQFDLTLGIYEKDKKLKSEFYATFGDEKMKLQIGLDQIKNNSEINVFFNLRFENILSKENFGSNVIVTSKDSIFGLRNLSLKSFRKKNLDRLWKKYINFN